MKTYILRDPKTVEPQNHDGSRPATNSAPTPGPVLFIGLDVHTASIAVSLAPSGSTEP